MRIVYFLTAVLCALPAFAQRYEFGVHGGISMYDKKTVSNPRGSADAGFKMVVTNERTFTLCSECERDSACPHDIVDPAAHARSGGGRDYVLREACQIVVNIETKPNLIG